MILVTQRNLERGAAVETLAIESNVQQEMIERVMHEAKEGI
jgi:hypothetical protein